MDIKPIPTRERCAACHHISAVGFFVPHHVWKAVVHISLRDSILCLQCFTERADEKLIPWEEEIKFYPVSLLTHLQEVRRINL